LPIAGRFPEGGQAARAGGPDVAASALAAAGRDTGQRGIDEALSEAAALIRAAAVTAAP
jgi:hypothetical protein